jgi:tetratricopeptide (TPR) repeat protein
MTKPGLALLVMATLVVALVATWIFTRGFDQPEPHGQNDISIESGIALFNEKKYSEAAAVFEKVPPGHPQEWYSLYYLGSSYIMLEDFPAAAQHLEIALSLNPTNTRIMHALGVTYFKLGNLKMSKAYFASILEIDPEDAEARGLMDIMADLERQQPGSEATPNSKNRESENN